MLSTLFFATYMAMVLGSIPLWRNAILKIRSGKSVLLARPRIGSPLGLIDVAIMFTTWVMGQFGSVTVATLFLGIRPSGISELSSSELAFLTLMVALGQIVSTGTGMLLIWFRYRRWDIFGIQPENFAKDFIIGLQAILMVIPGVMLLQWLLTFLVKYEHSTLEMLSKDQSLLTIGVTWFAAVLVAAFCEELFFRGVLQAWLQRLGYVGNSLLEQVIAGGWGDEPFPDPAFQPQPEHETPELALNEAGLREETTGSLSETDPIPDLEPVVKTNRFSSSDRARYVIRDSSTWWLPIFASAAVFALAHVGQGAAPIPLYVFGFALGYLYRQTGSIMPCIVLHLGLNGYSMFWFTLQILFPEVDALENIQPVH